jgi:uncharacterized OB-fold protein
MQLPRFHRLRSAYYRLEGQLCSVCGAVQFPPRTSCSACRAGGLERHRLSGRGSVFSYSEAAQAPEGFAPPYLMALVKLEEGPVIAAQLTDVEPEEIEIGMAVEMVTRRIREMSPQGYLVYGYKFRPRIELEAEG